MGVASVGDDGWYWRCVWFGYHRAMLRRVLLYKTLALNKRERHARALSPRQLSYLGRIVINKK